LSNLNLRRGHAGICSTQLCCPRSHMRRECIHMVVPLWGNERATGTINPGLLYLADKYQLGGRQSFRKTGPGAVAWVSSAICTSSWRTFCPNPWESRFLRRRQEKTPRALNGLRRVMLLVTGPPRYARGPRISERSSPESDIARALTPAAFERTPPHPKAVRRRG
jgi:hypothetical protein